MAAGLLAATGAALVMLHPSPEPKPSPKPQRATLASWVEAPSLDTLAQAERIQDPAHRRQAVAAIIEHWAVQDPQGATRACLQISPAVREAALAALFGRLQSSPERVLEADRALSTLDPANARSYGYAAVRALAEGPSPEMAARLAQDADSAYQADLTNEAFFRWASLAPESASLFAFNSPTGADKQVANDSALSGWAGSDPKGLAETAIGFPDGPIRDSALTKALRSWMISDSKAAEAWIIGHPQAAGAAERALRRD
jgi:hypothetical protein